MEQSLSRSVPIPVKAALTVAVLTALALTIVALLMLRIDLTAREFAAAERAEREFTDLAEKLPGLADDPELASLGQVALAELGAIARETGQDRLVAVRSAAMSGDDWPAAMRGFGRSYVRFGTGEETYAGVRRALADGSEVVIAYPVRSTGPLSNAFRRWGIALAAVIVAIAGLVALITGAAISRRIAQLNALCERVEQGEVEARSQVASADEIGILASHMNTMLDELQRRLEALRDTTDGIAHDLRTPLARVQGRLSRLEENATSERDRAEARLAAEELALLMDAFNALLELREIETHGLIPADRFRVDKAVEDAIELYEAVAEETHGLRIVRHLQPCEAPGNAQLIVRAVANLIDNAIKVSPKGSAIEITLGCEGEWAEIAVTDSGPGLSWPMGPHRSTLGGHGIGLRIVRAVARQHGGSFALTDLAPGARATLALPTRRLRQVS